MLKSTMMQEILDLKLHGYSVSEIQRYYEGKPGKAPSLPTIRKYYRMDSIPQDINAKLTKDKAFGCEPFRSAIIQILNNNQADCHISSVYDVLEERFVDTGQFAALPGNQQTLRNYVHFLKSSGTVTTGEDNGRIYDYVPGTPPAQQLLIDFGQTHICRGLDVHFICLLLRFSRVLGVYAQDHTFNAEEACRAICRFFTKCGGRPQEIVIDQDAVFVASETYGEVIETKTFAEFLREQDIRLWVCNKSDPESKGPIENTVGFVKKNYFSARKITCIEEVMSTLPGWVERKNKRIHQSTFFVPRTVFEEVECLALRSPVPSVFEDVPLNLIGVKVGSMPYVQYRSSKYSVPRESCFTQVFYRATGEKLLVYDKDRRHLCTHTLNECKGSINQLPEHQKEPSVRWMLTAERLRSKYNCFDFQHFINGFKKENPRHLDQQLAAVERFLDAENPERTLVAEVMAVCCRDFRYKFSQFKAVYDLAKARRATPQAVALSDVQKADLGKYREAFNRRCVGQP